MKTLINTLLLGALALGTAVQAANYEFRFSVQGLKSSAQVENRDEGVSGFWVGRVRASSAGVFEVKSEGFTGECPSGYVRSNDGHSVFDDQFKSELSTTVQAEIDVPVCLATTQTNAPSEGDWLPSGGTVPWAHQGPFSSLILETGTDSIRVIAARMSATVPSAPCYFRGVVAVFQPTQDEPRLISWSPNGCSNMSGSYVISHDPEGGVEFFQ